MGVHERAGAGDHCFVARVRGNEKKPCKHWFTGFIVVAKGGVVLPEVMWRRGVALVAAPSGVARAPQDRVKKQ